MFVFVNEGSREIVCDRTIQDGKREARKGKEKKIEMTINSIDIVCWFVWFFCDQLTDGWGGRTKEVEKGIGSEGTTNALFWQTLHS